MPNVLTSWKEIAQYLGKGVRTVQRWEAAYGLPVRRATGNNQHAILAIPEELDAWLRSQSTGQSELDTLRRELTALRAENAFLRQQLEQRSTPARFVNGFDFDRNPPIRNSHLSAEASQLTERTARARSLQANRGLLVLRGTKGISNSAE